MRKPKVRRGSPLALPVERYRQALRGDPASDTYLMQALGDVPKLVSMNRMPSRWQLPDFTNNDTYSQSTHWHLLTRGCSARKVGHERRFVSRQLIGGRTGPGTRLVHASLRSPAAGPG